MRSDLQENQTHFSVTLRTCLNVKIKVFFLLKNWFYKPSWTFLRRLWLRRASSCPCRSVDSSTRSCRPGTRWSSSSVRGRVSPGGRAGGSLGRAGVSGASRSRLIGTRSLSTHSSLYAASPAAKLYVTWRSSRHSPPIAGATWPPAAARIGARVS